MSSVSCHNALCAAGSQKPCGRLDLGRLPPDTVCELEVFAPWPGAAGDQVFFPDRNPISPTQEFCENCDIEVSVRRLDRLSESPVYGQFGLTDRRFETVVSAYECGYYDIPREMNQAELAEHFDVSHQAVSERLRRAHGTIIRNVLDYRIQQRDHDISPRMRPEVDV